ncbi:MAG: glycosyltransferase family 1 protein, partial [Gemmatimonadales bacterium]
GVIGPGGLAAQGDGASFADAVEVLLARPVDERRAAAVARAGQFEWTRTVAGFLAVHGLAPAPVAA